MDKKVENTYFSLILESKNFHIEQQFINLIYNNFELNKVFKYKLTDILKQNPTQLKDVNLVIAITDKDFLFQFLKKHSQIERETGKTKQSIIQNFKESICSYQKILSTKTVYLIFNYNLLSICNEEQKRNTIAHEITHILENNQSQWLDLLPKNLTFDNFILYIKVNKIINELNINYDYMYYLTSGIEFEAMCTILQRNKSNININNVNSDYLKSEQYNKLPDETKRLYMFIFLNKCFDESGQRLKYIKENLE